MAGRERPRAVVVPARPAMLVMGDREVPIDEWPLAKAVDERRAVELERTEDDQLVIAPARGGPAAGGAVLVVSAAVLPALVAATLELPAWLAVVVGLAAVAAALALLRGMAARLRRFRFDRRSGELVIERRGGFRDHRRVERTVPLATIAAVQLLFNGRHSVVEPQGAGDQQVTTSREFPGYELNLVLDDPGTPRLHLIALADWEWLRWAGTSVAEFLSVPILDRLYHGE